MPCDSVFVCILRFESGRRAAVAHNPEREELMICAFIFIISQILSFT